MAFIQENLMLLLPIVVLYLLLLAVALLDWLRRPEGKMRGPKWVWLLVILFINTIGPIVYLVAGRQDD